MAMRRRRSRGGNVVGGGRERRSAVRVVVPALDEVRPRGRDQGVSLESALARAVAAGVGVGPRLPGGEEGEAPATTIVGGRSGGGRDVVVVVVVVVVSGATISTISSRESSRVARGGVFGSRELSIVVRLETTI